MRSRSNILFSSCFVVILCFISQAGFAQFDNIKLNVLYDSAWVYKNLKLIPIRYYSLPPESAAPVAKGVRVLTLEEALRDKKIKVSELPKKAGADLSVLKITNTSADFIMINSGEVVRGGKQDRAAGETVLLPPAGEDYYLKAYCVEQGRWEKKEHDFSYFNSAELAVKKAIDIEKNQTHVWNEIQHEFYEAKVESETTAYAEIAKHNQSAADTGYIRFFTEQLKASDSLYAGFIAVTGNRVIATDLYVSPALTLNAFPSILHAYTRFAVSFGAEPILPNANIRSFMEPILGDTHARKEFLVHHGTMHYFNGKPIHLVAYGP